MALTVAELLLRGDPWVWVLPADRVYAPVPYIVTSDPCPAPLAADLREGRELARRFALQGGSVLPGWSDRFVVWQAVLVVGRGETSTACP